MATSERKKPRSLLEIRNRPVELNTHGGYYGIGTYGRYSSALSGVSRVTIGALCDLFTKLDRTLAGKRHSSIYVTPCDDKTCATSMTDGTQIMISEKMIGDAVRYGREDMMALFGLNYHELSHILYTPMLDRDTRTWLLEGEGGRGQAFNILEDMRIEHMVRQVYPKMTEYFLATCYKFYFDVPKKEFEKAWFSYITLAERRYVPREDRLDARTVTVKNIGEDDVQAIEAIEAEYVRMTKLGMYDFLPDRARELIEEFAKLINRTSATKNPDATKSVQGMKSNQLCDDKSHQHTGRMNSTKRAPNGDTDGYEELDGDDDESLAGQTRAKGYSRAGKATIDHLSKTLAENVQIQADMQQAKEIVDKAKFNLDQAPAEYHEMQAVTGDMRRQRDTFVRELTRIQDQVDPGWDRYQATGRLNIGRYMQGDDLDTVFDDWHEDRSDALDVEAKLMLDMSGSMAGDDIKQMSQAFWVICSALDKIDAKVEAIGYSDSCFSLRDPNKAEDETQYRKYGSLGGTNPRVGIAKARHDFAHSNSRHKLFVILTDGGWSSSEDDEDILDMRDLDVTTVMVWVSQAPLSALDNNSREMYRHKCEHFIAVANSNQLSQFTRETVTALLTGAVRDIGR